MTSNSNIHYYKGLKGSSLAWKLLAAPNGHIILAILKTHLFDNKDERVLKSSVLCEKVSGDLEAFREEKADFYRLAQSFIDDMVAKRYLTREYIEGDDEERLWLSAAAVDAIRFVEGLANPRSSVTESRLDILMQALSKLSKDADKDAARRLDRLIEERERLDREIKALEGGLATVISDAEALERVREIISLGSDMAEDFIRVQEQYKDIHQKLRDNILKSSENLKEILGQVFSDLNRMNETEAGRTFEAFYSLLRDTAQRMGLDRSLEIIFGLEFFQDLDQKEKHFLKNFVDILFDQSSDIDKITNRFSETLLSLLQSREYKERHTISRLLDENRKLAGELGDLINMSKVLDFNLELPMSKMDSISRLKLMDYYPEGKALPIVKAESPDVDLGEALMSAQSDEIDFETLKRNIVEVLKIWPKASVGDVLYRFPATQGLGSVVGLVHLAYLFGERESQTESVSWQGLDGAHRSASIDKWYFFRERIDELSA
jgi:archaellum component FlaC